MTETNETDLRLSLISLLNKTVNSTSFYGECSVQSHLNLKDGRILRIGFTDDDVAEHPGKIWFDIYDPKTGKYEKHLGGYI